MNEPEQMTEVIQIRVTPTLKAFLEDEARRRSQPISTIIRWAIYEQYQAASNAFATKAQE